MPKYQLRIESDGEYAPVALRITRFYARYPTGRIVTELVSREPRDGGVEVTFRAMIYRAPDEAEPAATGWASEREGDGDINAVACVENTETSAIGRALANLGFTASRQRPSREEMEKADRERARLARRATETRSLDADPLQRQASALHDLLNLIAKAERAGFPSGRAQALRSRLLVSRPTIDEIGRLERHLRGWIASRQGPR